MEYPTLFYRTPGPHRLTGDTGFDYIAVADDEAAAKARANGWHSTLAAACGDEGDTSLLDKTAPEIIEALSDKSGQELLDLLEAEQNGKTRKGVIAAIEDAIGKVSE